MSKIPKLTLISITILLSGLVIDLLWFYQPSVLEREIGQWLGFGRPDWLTNYVALFTDSVFGLGLLTGVITILKLRKKQWPEVMVLLSALLLILSQFPIKDLFHRPRPMMVLGDTVFGGYGLPSGHALTVVLLVGALIIVYHRTKFIWPGWLVIGLVYIGLIGWSRIYLGAHYLSDVIAGYTLSLIYLAFLNLIYSGLKTGRIKI